MLVIGVASEPKMTSEVRKNPAVLTERVIIASERAKRPSDFQKEKRIIKPAPCFFCPGNEHQTPPEILSYRYNGTEANHDGWWVRVVPNKFPAFDLIESIKKRVDGPYESYPARGIHEVVITKYHDVDFGNPAFDIEYNLTRESVWALFARKQDLALLLKDKSSPAFEGLDTGEKEGALLKYVLAFKNHGAGAGASLDHGHLQLMGSAFVPGRVKRELDTALMHYEETNSCLYCDLIKHDLETGDRIVDVNNDFLSVTPFASRFPFEVWVLPRRHETHYYLTGDNGSEGTATSLSNILRRTFLRLDQALNDPDYNFCIHDSPLDFNGAKHYHWHIEISPVLSKAGGWEKGTEDWINPVPPEDAADYLRSVRF